MVNYVVKLLGSPSAPTVLGDKAFGLNSLGAVAGVAQIPTSQAVLWNPAPIALPTVGPHSLACAANDSGEVVGTQGELNIGEWGEIYNPDHAFLYTSTNGVVRDLANIFGAKMSVATDINDNGLIAAWAGDFKSFRAFRYDSRTGSAPTNLGVLPGHTESRASAINNNGQVTGISRVGAATHGFLYDRSLVDLGVNLYPNDINDHGQIVGERLLSGSKNWIAFLCNTSSGNLQFQDLGPLPMPGFVGSVATAVNNQGAVVGYSFTAPGAARMVRAFLRPANGSNGQMLDLNSLIPWNSGWLLHRACAINDNGQIAGIGTYNGQYRAYLLTPESIRPPDEVIIDPWALLLTGELYVKLKTLPDPPPDFLNRLRERVHAMGPEERRQALARVKALGALARALEEELSRR